MIEHLDNLDKQLMLMINYDGGTFLDTFWYDYSYKWTWIAAAIALLWTLYRTRLNNKDFIVDILMIALIITLCDQVSSGIIKNLVCRPRPSHCEELEGALHIVNGYRSGQYGFVSSHAANAWGLTIFLWTRLRSTLLRSTMVIWTLLTCYSRMYLGVHYLGDIIGGTIVGILIASLMTTYAYPFIQHQIQRNYHIPQRKPMYLADTWPPLSAIALTALTIVILAATPATFQGMFY